MRTQVYMEAVKVPQKIKNSGKNRNAKMTFSEFSEKARGGYLQKITGEKELSIFEAKRRNLSERLQNYFFSAKQTHTQSNITQYYSQKK